MNNTTNSWEEKLNSIKVDAENQVTGYVISFPDAVDFIHTLLHDTEQSAVDDNGKAYDQGVRDGKREARAEDIAAVKNLKFWRETPQEKVINEIIKALAALSKESNTNQ